MRAFFKKHGIKADFIGQAGNATDVIAKLDDSGGFDLLVMGSVATRVSVVGALMCPVAGRL